MLTNPNMYNAEDFIYLVNALGNWKKETSPEEIEEKVRRIFDPNQFYNGSLIARMTPPSAKVRLGWSEGDIAQTRAFSNLGLIIAPSSEDLIYVAWNCELGSPLDPAELKDFAIKHRGKKRHIINLLTNVFGCPYIPNSGYNHIIMRGDTTTNIRGIYCVETINKTEVESLNDIIEKVTGRKVPIIAFPENLSKSYANRVWPHQNPFNRFHYPEWCLIQQHFGENLLRISPRYAGVEDEPESLFTSQGVLLPSPTAYAP